MTECRTEQNKRTEQDRPGHARTGQEITRQDRRGQDRTSVLLQ